MTVPVPAVDLQWPKNMNELPKEFFVREDVFELEQERIFRGPEWHPVAHKSEVPEKGDFKTYTVGGSPLLIIHGLDGEIRVFYNTCTHRGVQLVTEPFGNKKKFQCPYHRWMFDSEGELRGCPSMEEYSPGFKREDYALETLRTDTYFGIIFITMSDKTPPLEDYLGVVKKTLREALGSADLRLLGHHKASYKCNWKTASDNDTFHGPLLHKAFAMLNWQGGNGSLHIDTETGHWAADGEIKGIPQSNLIKDQSLVSYSDKDPLEGDSRLVMLFPLVTIIKHLDSLSIRFYIPWGVEDTDVYVAYFSRMDDDAELVTQRIRQSSNLLGPCGMVSMEDAAVFHRVHTGSRTPGNAIFQKGVSSFDKLETEFKQNDESGTLLRWEHYRKVMGFERAMA